MYRCINVRKQDVSPLTSVNARMYVCVNQPCVIFHPIIYEIIRVISQNEFKLFSV